MSEIRALIEQLVAQGIDAIDAAEIVARAAIFGAGAAPKPRSAGAIRQERYRRNKASQVTECDATHTPPEVSPHTPLPNPSGNLPPSPPKGGSSPVAMGEFDEFWSIYPHKIGKPKAREAFLKARKRAPFEEIMAGLRAYVAKTDDRPWCNPATWLNQDRWGDEPAPPLPARRAAGPPDDRSRMNQTLDRLIAGQATNEPDHQTSQAGYHSRNRGSVEGAVQLSSIPAWD